MPTKNTATFSERLLAWWRQHGRHDLPWQRRPTPYRVWVSEIMLQQTQVATVIPYYQRFVTRFPGVRALADAPLDHVLGHWSGLGYYARARNLHRAAVTIRDNHGGRFPRDLQQVLALPGIGRSTAGAILSLALGQRHPILDGNVKRVLARHGGIEGWPGATPVAKQLWSLAEARLPARRGGVADRGLAGSHNQALMDLGATLCTASQPACERCPVSRDCAALAAGTVARIPASKPRRSIPERSTVFVMARSAAGAVLLERRPPAGIWGGLWCPPECDEPGEVVARLARLGVVTTGAPRRLETLKHTFSHFRLKIAPVLVDAEPGSDGIRDPGTHRWVTDSDLPGLGLAAPVARLVACIATLNR